MQEQESCQLSPSGFAKRKALNPDDDSGIDDADAPKECVGMKFAQSILLWG
jgi:hypothetical protein